MAVEPHLFIAFVAASMALLIVPGPTIILVVSQSLAHGNRTAFASVIGVGFGDLAAASLSLIGVGTVLAASAAAFAVIKWLGAAYLIWIGVKMWRSPVTPVAFEAQAAKAPGGSWPVFRDAFTVTLFNPKGIVFFIAFVPQFITADRGFAAQAAVLVATFVVLGMINAAGYAGLAAYTRRWMRRPGVLRTATRLGATFLVSAGIASLFVRRSA